jgi:hypothetical protein
MRGDKRISLRLFLLLLFSGGLMGWMVLVITAYYVVRTDENQWAQRNIEAITNIAPAAGGSPAKTGGTDKAAAPSR